jgi:hypothetical protein
MASEEAHAPCGGYPFLIGKYLAILATGIHKDVEPPMLSRGTADSHSARRRLYIN